MTWCTHAVEVGYFSFAVQRPWCYGHCMVIFHQGFQDPGEFLCCLIGYCTSAGDYGS